MTATGARLRRMLPGLWAGMLLCVAGMATPPLFALLERASAAQVAGRILATEAWVSLGVSVLLMLLERHRARQRAEAGLGSVVSGELLLLLAAVFCTVVGYFVLQPLMPAARLGQGRWSFAQLHAASSAFFALKLLLVLALAWRAARPTED